MKKRGLAILLGMMLGVAVIFGGLGNTASAATYVTYENEYNIENILSGFQYFVKGDLTAASSGHMVGSVAVGGTLNTASAVGDAQITASYVNHLAALVNFPQQEQANYVGSTYASYVNSNFYYNTADSSVQSWLMDKLTYNPDYIAFDTAFTNLIAESAAWAGKGTGAYTLTGTVLTINLDKSADTFVTIPSSDYSAATEVVLHGLDSIQDIVNHQYTISITGIGSTAFSLDFSKIKLEGDSNAFNNRLKDLNGSMQGGQVNFEGMKLVWNLPDATGAVGVTGLSGHLVAPQASLTVAGGNFEGGIIATSVSTDSEGHYYLFNKVGTAAVTGKITGTGTESTETETTDTETNNQTDTDTETEDGAAGSITGDGATESVTDPENNTETGSASETTGTGTAVTGTTSAVSTGTAAANSQTDTAKAVKTGDTTNLGIWLFLTVISAAVIVLEFWSVIQKRRKNS